MISLDVKLAGNKTESLKLKSLLMNITPAMMRGMNKATIRLERAIKKQLSLGGRAPRRKGERRTKNEGAHLRIQDGTLRTSWKHKRAQAVAGGVEGHVASNVVYSAIHEFGGMAGRNLSVRIPERPYVKPAIGAERDAMVKDIIGEVIKILR